MDSDKSLDECGCAPTPAERRGLWPAVSRRRALALGAFGAAVLRVGGIGGPMLPAAFAADYPSWDDVQAAMANEAAKAAEVSKIQGLIQSLNQEVARTQAAAKVASDCVLRSPAGLLRAGPTRATSCRRRPTSRPRRQRIREQGRTRRRTALPQRRR